MAKLRPIEIASIIAYGIEVILLLFPTEILVSISELPTWQKTLLVSAMIVIPLLPFLVGRAEMLYCVFCRLFRVSSDEKKLLGALWGTPDRDWNEEDLSNATGLDIKKVHNLVRRLKSRKLIVSGEVYSKEQTK